MAGISIKGMEGLTASFGRLMKQAETEVNDASKQVAGALVDALVSNIPVWSGSTVRSVHVGGPSFESTDRSNPQQYGPTNRMAMGSEPMRGGAEDVARGSVAAANYNLGTPVPVTAGSDAWPLVEQGAAPGGPNQRVRNQAVVSEIAVQKVRAAFKFVK